MYKGILLQPNKQNLYSCSPHGMPILVGCLLMIFREITAREMLNAKAGIVLTMYVLALAHNKKISTAPAIFTVRKVFMYIAYLLSFKCLL